MVNKEKFISLFSWISSLGINNNFTSINKLVCVGNAYLSSSESNKVFISKHARFNKHLIFVGAVSAIKSKSVSVVTDRDAVI